MRQASPAGIGGFIGLEDPTLATRAISASGPWPAGGVDHATGRAALRAILESLRPSLVHIPSFICRVILEPLVSTGTSWRRYATADDLSHAGAPAPADGELLVVIDHFGLQGEAIEPLARRHGARLVVDATQALFAAPPAGAWAFTSWRKFLGVPDGATLHGPSPIDPPSPADRDAPSAHLELRAIGRLDASRAAFLEHEGRLDDRRRGPSAASCRLLSRIDLERVVRRRRANFLELHERLGPRNTLAVRLPPSGAPHAYPFVPERELDRRVLHRQRIFVPTFWPEMPGADEPNAVSLARRLLPLPLDQRYDSTAMELVADAVLEQLRR